MVSRSRFTELLAASVIMLSATACGGRSVAPVIATLGSFGYGYLAPSADGRFFLADVDDSLLLKVDARSGAVTTVARGHFEDLVLSPEGNRIAFDRDTNNTYQVWSARFDAARGTVDSLTRVADSASLPAFSPDGHWIAFARNFTRGVPDSLAVVSVTGARRAVPALGETWLVPVGWSRDGGAIYYTANLHGRNNHAIYKVDLSSGVTQTLIERNAEPQVRVSSDERYLVYRPNSARYAVATVRGEHVTDIDVPQFGFGREIGDPQWLPGTTSLVYPSLFQPRVLLAHAFDGSDSVSLSDSAAFTVSPSVSTDGKWLAAISAGPGEPRILIQPMMMAGEPRLIDIGMPIGQVAGSPFLLWSPDGRYVAVPVGNVDGLIWHPGPTGLALVDTRAGTARRLTLAQAAPSQTYGRFIWSPDSRAIRYGIGFDSAAGPHRPMEIHEASLDGGDRLVRVLRQCCGGVRFPDYEHAYTKPDAQLTDLRTGTPRTVFDPAILPVPDPGNAPPLACFTPDGTYAALPTSASGRGPYNRVMIVSMESGEHHLGDGGVTRMGPNNAVCHPDSKHVVLTGFDSTGVAQAVSVAIDGSSRRVITQVNRDLAGMILLAISPDGKWLITSRKVRAGPLQIVTQAALPGARP